MFFIPTPRCIYVKREREKAERAEREEKASSRIHILMKFFSGSRTYVNDTRDANYLAIEIITFHATSVNVKLPSLC
jgi:hypothetical protein